MPGRKTSRPLTRGRKSAKKKSPAKPKTRTFREKVIEDEATKHDRKMAAIDRRGAAKIARAKARRQKQELRTADELRKIKLKRIAEHDRREAEAKRKATGRKKSKKKARTGRF